MKNWIGVWVFIYSLAALAESPPLTPTETPHSTPEASADSSWLGAAQRELAEREYHLSPNDLGLQAPNRAHGFRSYFSSEGVNLVQREAESEALASLSLVSVGRAGSEITLGAADVVSEGSRATLHWPEISVQYDNDPTGLHQTITVDQSPAGTGLLELVLAVTDAEPQVSGDGIALNTPGLALQLGGIEAQDANGLSLPVTIDTSSSNSSSGTIRLAVSDKSATYPIKLQSVLEGGNNWDARLEVNQATAQLGYSVAGAGDVNGDGYADVIVGAPTYDNGESNEGAAFIYFGGAGSFNTTFDARLESNQAAAQMGRSVAGAGDVNADGYDDVVVGAENYDNGESDEGAAFVYFGGPGAFNITFDARLESNLVEAEMGKSVAGAGDVNGDGYADVIVGVEQFENDELTNNEGAAFIYFGGPGEFDTTADAHLETNQAISFMGSSVAGAGDLNGDGYADVIVGAELFDSDETDTNEGAAFVYFGGPGAFNTTADAQLESNQALAEFGNSVAAAGDVNGDGYADVIVGAHLYDIGASNTNEGAAFIYFGGSGTFNATPDAQLTSNQAGAQMGISVAGGGDINGDGYADVIAGAYQHGKEQAAEGAAFVYFGGPGAFDTVAEAHLEVDQDDAFLGFSVAGAGDVNGDGYADVIVGAYVYDNPELSEGAAFIYFGGAGEFKTTADGQIASNLVSGQLGVSVAGAGDVNGDGYADVIVGAPTYDNGQGSEGAAFIYLGASGTFDTNADAHLEPSQVNVAFGWSVAGAGDVNGDGYADVIVGAPFFDNGQTNEGAAFIYFGGSGAFDTLHDARLEPNQALAEMGQSVAGAGDVNGDGYADVIVGAPNYTNGQSAEGAAFIYFGGAGSFDTTADAQLEANQVGADMGESVAGAGDVNGDGYADVIVGVRFFDNGQADEGAAFIYFGGAGAFNTVADAQLQSNQIEAYMGVSVAGAGDVNGDGFSDVIVGADRYDNGQVDEGAAFIYFGGAGAFNTVADAQLQSNQIEAYMGVSVAGAGDVNGDGFSDVIVGATGYNNGQSSEGAAFIFFGGSGTFNPDFDIRLESNQTAAYLGISLAGAGDVNGDGVADVIVGATGYEVGQTTKGAAFVYFGTARGRPVQARQLESNAASRVQPWGLSQDSDGFVVSLNATSPRGRERARLQLEACPNGVPFGSLLCDTYVAVSWTEIGANPQGVTLTLAASGLTLDKLYHWRARVQYAPLHVTAPGVLTPPNPAAGPWRRLQANGDVADIRTGVNAPTMELIFEDGFE